jgi:hypothetical protein
VVVVAGRVLAGGADVVVVPGPAVVVVAGRVLAGGVDVVVTPATTTNWGAVAPVSRLA